MAGAFAPFMISADAMTGGLLLRVPIANFSASVFAITVCLTCFVLSQQTAMVMSGPLLYFIAHQPNTSKMRLKKL